MENFSKFKRGALKARFFSKNFDGEEYVAVEQGPPFKSRKVLK